MKKILSLITLTAVVGAAGAQQLNSAYFMDEYANRAMFNPAFTPEYGFFGGLAISEIALSASSNISPKTFLYPQNGQLVTFLDPSISAKTFNSAVFDKNDIDQSLQTNLVSFGFFTKKKSFWSGSITLKENLYTSMPGDLFRFLKTGMSTGTTGNVIYNMSDLTAGVDTYVDFAVGYSRQINQRIRVGARLKYVMGLAHANVNYNNLRLTLSDSEWRANGQGALNIAAKGLNFRNDENGYMDLSNAVLGNNIGVAGHGFGIDLGGTFKLGGLTIAAAVNDIGFIKWNNTTQASTELTDIVFNGFNNVDINNPDASFDQTLADLEEEAKKLMQFTQNNASSKSERKLRTNVRLSAAYDIFKDNPQNITIGAAYSGIVAGPILRQELFGTVVLKPLSWLSLSGTAGINLDTNAPFFGSALNISPRGFNFFLALQTASAEYGSVSLPGSSNMRVPIPLDELGVNVQFGISFSFGQSSRKADRL